MFGMLVYKSLIFGCLITFEHQNISPISAVILAGWADTFGGNIYESQSSHS